MKKKMEEKVMQEVKSAEEAMRVAQEASEKVFLETEEIIFKGVEELKNTSEGDIILMNVLESCCNFGREWFSLNEDEVKADEALRYAIWKAERILNEKIKSRYI